MTFEFGTLRLDEPARVLELSEREVILEPRVFDLLAYLVRNRTRVVPKDELLDVLWPGVTVTDNSLQRAVSLLRRALREGGIENAIRSFPRNGYRFCVGPELSDAEGAGNAVNVLDELGAARKAIAEHRWNDAANFYKKADTKDRLTGEDFDAWALALQCFGKPAEAIPVLGRAVSAHSQEDNVESAATAAVVLSTIHMERGEAAVSNGWLARAQEMVASIPDPLTDGHVFLIKSRIAASEGHPHQAFDLAEAAYNFGLRRSNVRIEALGLMYRGFFRLSLGDTRAGLEDQDHAATLALSDNLDPITGGMLYCNILWACRTFGDWSRAQQWTIGYLKFCSDSSLELSGSCQLHRAEMLGVGGALPDALAHVNDAVIRLSVDAPWAIGDAHRVLGDIQSAIGNDEAALAAYEKSYALGWNPEPGHALLLLERGEPEAAYESLERSLIGQSWWTLQRQGMLLGHLAVVATHADRYVDAQSLIDDLVDQEQRWPMPSVRALTNEASALLAHKRGDSNEALRHLHLARQLWTSIDSRYNAARLRLQIAGLQLDTGNQWAATTEIAASEASAQELGSHKLKRQCLVLRGRLASVSGTSKSMADVIG